MKYLACLCATMMATAALPAVGATYYDYSVYTTNNVTIAGGSYGTIASGTFATSHAISGGNYVSRTASSAALTLEAISFSQQLSGLAATGALAVIKPTQGVGTGSGAGINVFNLDGTVLSSLISLTFTGLGDGAIVNVSGKSITAPIRYDFGSLLAQNVIFNFYEAVDVSFAGADVRGSILAPYAALRYAGGTIGGTVAADSFASAGTTIGGAAFVGRELAGVPEPMTWMMSILGFGLIGASIRRRRPLPAGADAVGGVVSPRSNATRLAS